jgi:hypothetical protein
MTETIWEEIEDFGKQIWANWGMVFEDFVVQLAKQLATDEMALLTSAVETEIAKMDGGFTFAKVSAFVPDVIATFAAQSVVIGEKDIAKAVAAVIGKIDSLNAAGQSA